MAGIHVRTAAALVAAAGLVALSACAGKEYPRPEPPAAAVNPDNRGDGVALATSELDGLGTVVTDQRGMTLYRFERDSARPPTSNCDGDCARQWPPVLGESVSTTVRGVDRAMIGTVTRRDGGTQLTLNGWPLYRFAKDTAPGEARGQGVGGTWYAITPEGRKASGQPATGSGGGSDGGYGY